jgi:hypothetical protein
LNPSAASQLFNVTVSRLNPQDLSGSALQAALGLLFYSIWETPDLVATRRGIPYDNRLTFYLGSSNDFALKTLGSKRVASDANARSYLRHFYQPTGKLAQPLVSCIPSLTPSCRSTMNWYISSDDSQLATGRTPDHPATPQAMGIVIFSQRRSWVLLAYW